MVKIDGGWDLPSFWLAELAPFARRPPLKSSQTVDVAIVGAGLSGLWTAFYLTTIDPGLKVAVVERETAGYGASGRNGGWVSSLFPVGWEKLNRQFGKDASQRLSKELVETLNEVESRVAELGIDCDFTRAGAISFMRNEAQVKRGVFEVAEAENLRLGAKWSLLNAAESDALLCASLVHGATFTPDCATVQPARLVRGLADAVEARGVAIYENSPVNGVENGSVYVGSTRLAASKVVVATEGYTAGIDQWKKTLLPLYSMMIVTEPLSDSQYEAIGSPAEGLCFADHRNLVIYGQITRDRRVAFGGRGAPYHFGSRVMRSFDTHGPTRNGLEDTLYDLFPALEGIRIVRHWGGPLGVSRDWLPRVSKDSRGSIWRIGGYAGDGVAASNLCGRVAANEVLGVPDESMARRVFSTPPRDWEPEPLRWAGVNLGLGLTRVVDALEDRGAGTGWLDRLRRKLIGQG